MSANDGVGSALNLEGRATVLVTGGALAPEATALLEEHAIRLHHAAPYSGPDEVARLAATQQVDGIIHRTGRLTAEMIGASPRLRVIAKHGSGVDNIDLAAASERGIPVMRTLVA
ncbi:MAG: hydroxyacid dehydrogenase, partial [Pseudomonadota bacterium]|nr:hydroxyacid dehydrogenase [Pseudomonadota bacterium]